MGNSGGQGTSDYFGKQIKKSNYAKKRGKMYKSYWKPKYTYQVVEWLHNYYQGKYSKLEIKKHNVWGWYKNIREKT